MISLFLQQKHTSKLQLFLESQNFTKKSSDLKWVIDKFGRE